MSETRNEPSRRRGASYLDSHRRWLTIRYLSTRRYPATVGEISGHVSSYLDSDRAEIEDALTERDLRTLAECDVVDYDSYTGLVRLPDERGTFEKYLRRAANAGLVLDLTPPRMDVG